jgi:hypothetical protein
MPPSPADAELVDIDLPEGVHRATLEPLEGDRLPNEPNHEPVPLQDPVNGNPAHSDAATGKGGVDPERAPGGVLSPELEDAIDEVSMDPVRTTVRAPGLVPKPLHAFFSVVSTPTT